MRARKYNRAIVINRATEATDGYGGFITTEAVLYSGWANIVTKKAYIKNEQGQSDNISQTVITVRNRYDLTIDSKTDSIHFGGLVYNIDSVLNLDLNNIDVEIYASQRN